LTYEALADGVTGADLLREVLGPFGAGGNLAAGADATAVARTNGRAR
jgi:hypothetical protein